jgi:acetyl esterase/lipase
VKIFRLLKKLLVAVALLVAVLGLIAGVAWLYFHPKFTWTRGLAYGQRNGETLTVDVLQPPTPNGRGVLLMVSGSWKSGTNSLRPWLVAPLLRRGYTVFPVYHVSQPHATVMEIVADVNRAVRFVRTHAREYGVDPDRLGVTGGSSGGHLSLMLATRGGPGPAAAPDAVDRASSAVQAVAIFFPVTDLLNLGDSTENLHDGGPPKSFTKAFAQEPKNLPVWQVTGREMSPIYFVASNLPPTVLYHGDADTLVPLDQSQRFRARAQEVGAKVDLVIHPGFGHGPVPVVGWPKWLAPVTALRGVGIMMLDLMEFADWFDVHLKAN